MGSPKLENAGISCKQVDLEYMFGELGPGMTDTKRVISVMCVCQDVPPLA